MGGRIPQARQRVRCKSKDNGGAPCGTLPLSKRLELSAERGRSKAGTNTAASTRLLCARLAAQPDPHVIPCRRAVVLAIGMQYSMGAPAQPAVAADALCARDRCYFGM